MDYCPNLSKKMLSLILVSACLAGCRNNTRRAYEIFGLPAKSEIIPSLKLGIPLIVVGFLLVFLVGKWLNNRNSEKTFFVGALILIGVGTMIGGIIVLLPAIMWLEAIVSGIFSFIMAVFVAILVIIGIGSLIRK